MKNLKRWGMGIIAYLLCIGGVMPNTEASTLTAGKAHIGTFNGSTTFRTSSSNGINPGLFIEVRDAAGNLKQYTSDDGVVTVKNTKEGAYVTQAKLLGKTKYVDQETGEVLDQWEAGRNLKLESSKMPVLKTTGKNLMPINSIVPKQWSNDILNHKICDINLKPNTSYTFSNGFDGVSNTIRTRIYDDNNTLLVEVWGNQYKTFTTNTNENYWVLAYDFGNGNIIKDIQIEEGAKTAYEPYKSNILTTSEEVELRGVGEVEDELNLLTGELTQRVGEVVLNGSENWTLAYNTNDVRYNIYSMVLSDVDTTINNSFLNCLSDKAKTDKWSNINVNFTDKTFGLLSNRQLRVQFNGTLEELKNWLLSTKPTIQYIKTKSIKTVDLTSTHQFDVISDAVVQVKGDVLPTIYSVTVPSEPLTFAINPNGEEGQQFIAPDFKITNESKGPVFLELKSFQQVTNVFNDVSPDKYENWSYLTKDESRDIALALVPMKSEGWLTLNEGLKYVSTTENIELGSIKPGGTVDFSFSAYHGRVFDQNLFPEYRLVFTFGF